MNVHLLFIIACVSVKLLLRYEMQIADLETSDN